jgi:hypothetical protein
MEAQRTMYDVNLIIGKMRAEELMREAQSEREAQAAIRENRRNRNTRNRRSNGNDTNRLETGERN